MLLFVVMGLGAFWLTGVARKLPRIEVAAMAGVKPWACDACMSFWSTMMLVGLHYWLTRELAVLHYFGAAGLCMYLLETLAPPMPWLPPPPARPDQPPPPRPGDE